MPSVSWVSCSFQKRSVTHFGGFRFPRHSERVTPSSLCSDVDRYATGDEPDGVHRGGLLQIHVGTPRRWRRPLGLSSAGGRSTGWSKKVICAVPSFRLHRADLHVPDKIGEHHDDRYNHYDQHRALRYRLRVHRKPPPQVSQKKCRSYIPRMLDSPKFCSVTPTRRPRPTPSRQARWPVGLQGTLSQR
jgi:hypothetical protein